MINVCGWKEGRKEGSPVGYLEHSVLVAKLKFFDCNIALRWCMIRPPKMAVVLLSEHPLPDLSLLHLHPTHMADLPPKSWSLISKCLHICPS